jgi:hypothetical protein
MKIIFGKGAKIKVNGANPAPFAAVFGTDLNSLVVNNVEFDSPNIEGIAFGNFGTNPQGIRLSTPYDTFANTVQNVTIKKGIFTNLDNGIYIPQLSTSGSATRQVKTVRINDCVANGCTSSFVTADGEDIIIENCFADGKDVTKSYDAVSIHSGINVKVLSNTFQNFGLGQVVNIRNSPENHCGTKNIKVLENTFKDCPTTGTQVSLQSGESTYGVTDVLIKNNSYDNTSIGVLITCGNATSGTPFNRIHAKDNQLIDVTTEGISVKCNTTVWLMDSEISGNTGTVVSTTTGSGLWIGALQRGIVSNNEIYSTANANGHQSFHLDYIYFCTVSHNHIWPNDDTQTGTVITNMWETSFINNYVRGVYSFVSLTNCIIKNNNFRSNGTNEGRTFGNGWEQFNANVTILANAFPTAGAWNTGDKVINNAPTAGGFEGWVCTTGGTSGTWKGFGAIAA